MVVGARGLGAIPFDRALLKTIQHHAVSRVIVVFVNCFLLVLAKSLPAKKRRRFLTSF
jgi:hypothetical protein